MLAFGYLILLELQGPLMVNLILCFLTFQKVSTSFENLMKYVDPSLEKCTYIPNLHIIWGVQGLPWPLGQEPLIDLEMR